MCDLVRGFVRAVRLYHHLQQLLLGVYVAFHPFPRQLCQRQEGKWPQEFQGLACALYVGVHLPSGYIHQLPLCIDERLCGMARQLRQLGLLGFLDSIGVLATGGLGCLFGDHVHEVLLGFDKVVHRLAGQFHHVLALVGFSGLGCIHPVVSLLSGNLQKLLLHLDESIHAAAEQVGNRLCWRPLADTFLHTSHQDFVLFLTQFKKDSLPFNEVRHTLGSHFAQNGSRGMIGIGQLLSERVHQACILPHREIQEDPLRGKKTLNALLRPTRQKRNKWRLPGMSSGGLGLYGWHIYLHVCCSAASTKLYDFKRIVSIYICIVCAAAWPWPKSNRRPSSSRNMAIAGYTIPRTANT